MKFLRRYLVIIFIFSAAIGEALVTLIDPAPHAGSKSSKATTQLLECRDLQKDPKYLNVERGVQEIAAELDEIQELLNSPELDVSVYITKLKQVRTTWEATSDLARSSNIQCSGLAGLADLINELPPAVKVQEKAAVIAKVKAAQEKLDEILLSRELSRKLNANIKQQN
jgi:hypothetical protein